MVILYSCTSITLSANTRQLTPEFQKVYSTQAVQDTCAEWIDFTHSATRHIETPQHRLASGVKKYGYKCFHKYFFIAILRQY